MMGMYHYYNSFTIHLQELTGSDSLGALAVALSTVGEIPFLLLSGRIVRQARHPPHHDRGRAHRWGYGS